MCAEKRSTLSCPGIVSIFPASCGTQKLWITLSEVRCTSIARSAGMWMSFAVSKWIDGYDTAHHHRLPTTSMRSAFGSGLRRASVVRTVTTASTMRITSGTTTPPQVIIRSSKWWLAGASVSAGSSDRRPRRMA